MLETKKLLAKAVKNVAEKALVRDANSTTCTAVFQPKAPARLSTFKKTTK